MFQEELSLTRPLETPSERVIERSLDSSSSSSPAIFEEPVFETRDRYRFALAVFLFQQMQVQVGQAAARGQRRQAAIHDLYFLCWRAKRDDLE